MKVNLPLVCQGIADQRVEGVLAEHRWQRVDSGRQKIY